MPEKGLFLQNVIAVIWDFDMTLSPHYMQKPLFEAYDIDERTFWKEVSILPAYYKKAGIHVQRDTCYLYHLLSYVKEGIFADLTNERLRELGGEISFFPGIPDFFDRITEVVKEPEFADSDLHVENYIVSIGLAEMIRGSAIADKVDGIWASEFIEQPAPPGITPGATPEPGPISQVAGFLDNTTKTRAIFEINKGVNKFSNISVNDTIPEEERRVPFNNMIYVADGPSDIPSFSVVRKQGGLAYAVYGGQAQFEQAVRLQESGRVDACGPADYTEGTQTDMWIRLHIRNIAKRIMAERKKALEDKVGRGPVHLDD